MLVAARIVSGLFVVTFGFAWTVGQAGLETTNRNLCDLAAAVWWRPITDCHFANWIVWLWGIGALGALVFLIVDAVRWLRKGQQANAPKEQDDNLSDHYPDIRVADSNAAIALFSGAEGDKLIPLLEAEKISAWGRLMTGGAPTRIPGRVWRTNQLWFLPKNDGPGRINQTFIKSKGRTESSSSYFDVFLNLTQIKRVWPSFDPNPPVRLGVNVHPEVTHIPHYNRAQIDRLVEAIDAFYPIVLNLDRELESGVGMAKSMEALVLHNGPKHYLEQMDTLRLNLNDALGRLRLIKEQQGLYDEVCNIVASSNSFSDPFYAAWNELAGILRDMPDNLNARSVSIFVSGKKETFISLVSEFHQWVKQKKLELIERRKFYLRQTAMEARREPQKDEPIPSRDNRRRSATVPWPDFDTWDKKIDFRLFEIACLWVDQEPGLPLTAEAAYRFKVLEQAIWDKNLKIRSDSVREAIASAYIISKGGETKANPNWVISKDDLLLYAFGTDEKPRFLFPEERTSS
jgi:hypothetical protein